MADPLSQFSMLGSGFPSQLVSNPNATGSSQQQSPSDSMQPIGGLPNPEHSRMWMQLQQQASQQRTTSSGDIVGSQVTSNPFFVASLSFPSFSSPPFLPSLVSHPFFTTLRPPPYFFSFSSKHRLPTNPRLWPARVRLRQQRLLLRFSPSPPLTNELLNSQLISLSFRWLASNSCSGHPFLLVLAKIFNITTSSANFKTTQPLAR